MNCCYFGLLGFLFVMLFVAIIGSVEDKRISALYHTVSIISDTVAAIDGVQLAQLKKEKTIADAGLPYDPKDPRQLPRNARDMISSYPTDAEKLSEYSYITHGTDNVTLGYIMRPMDNNLTIGELLKKYPDNCPFQILEGKLWAGCRHSVIAKEKP